MKWFKRKTEKEKLEDKYRKLMEEAHRLSHSNRAAGDKKLAEADEILKKLESL